MRRNFGLMAAVMSLAGLHSLPALLAPPEPMLLPGAFSSRPRYRKSRHAWRKAHAAQRGKPKASRRKAQLKAKQRRLRAA